MVKEAKKEKDTRPIKTLEFKLYPNQSQVLTLTDWLDRGRKVWNNGLAILLEKDQQDWRKKEEFDPMEGNEAWQWFKNDWGKILWKDTPDEKKREGVSSWKKGEEWGLCCTITAYSRRDDEHYLVCPIRHPQPLEGAPRSLIYQATQLNNFCTRFKNGIVSDLLESWKAYKDKNRPNAKLQKFKGKRFSLTSLSNANASTTVKIKGDNKIQFPLIGNVRTKGLNNRVPLGSLISEARICRKASGWYLQLAVRHNWPVPNVEMPDVAVAIDPGVRFATSTDYGRQIDAPKFLAKQIKKLRREQRKMSRRLKDGGGVKGKNFLKQKSKVARLHERVGRQRNAFWHKESTYFVTSFGAIAIEDNSFNNMGRKAKAKPSQSGLKYERNNQAQKRGLNRALKDVACGRLKVMVETKAKIIGNEIHLVRSHHNSQTCSECGHVSKENRKSQSSFSCVACGHSLNADINAAINIYNRAEWSNRYNLHPRRLQVSIGKDTPVSLGESAKAISLPLSSVLLDNAGSQQEGDLSPRSEITEQPNPARGMNAENRQMKARSKTPEVCQNPETYTQLELWNSSA